MKKLFAMGAALFLFGAGVVGCQNAAEGVKEDTAKNAQAVGQAADRAGAAAEKATENVAAGTQEAAKNASAALALTPKVKAAITADPMLNDTRNTIDVDSKDNVVHLKGTVVNNEMKKRAGEVAQKTLTEANATDRLSNELVVKSR
jgi:osmotically-inducible protein OsmY